MDNPHEKQLLNGPRSVAVRLRESANPFMKANLEWIILNIHILRSKIRELFFLFASQWANHPQLRLQQRFLFPNRWCVKDFLVFYEATEKISIYITPTPPTVQDSIGTAWLNDAAIAPWRFFGGPVMLLTLPTALESKPQEQRPVCMERLFTFQQGRLMMDVSRLHVL